MNESASLALEVHPRLTPGAFLVSFCASKKKLAGRRNLTPESRDGFSYRFFWRIQKKWFLVSRPQGRQPLAFGFFSHERKEGRRQAKPDPGKPGRLFLPFLLAHTKEIVFGKTRSQRRSLWPQPRPGEGETLGWNMAVFAKGLYAICEI